MDRGFWDKLDKPIMALAPMADVTDAAFRQIIAKYGKPDVIWTEFVSCDGLCSREGRKNLKTNLRYSELERPIVAQLFGSDPSKFYECAKYIKKLGFDGIDINMGCPEKSICKQGSGAALIKTPEIAKEIIKETKRGAGGLPVSIKTRIGYLKDNLDEWIVQLLEVEPAAIIIHGRTKKEMSMVPTNWEAIGRAVKRTKQLPIDKRPLIIGNGDVNSLKEACNKVKKYGVDGVMVGRATFGNPWFFNPNNKQINMKDKFFILIEHVKLYEKLLKDKSFDIMKKHFKSYINGFKGAKNLRMKLMDCKDAEMVEEILNDYKI